MGSGSVGPDGRPLDPQTTRDSAESNPSVSDEWILALSAVTRAPIDLGIELGMETPFGLRLAGSYGFVPGAYLNLFTGALTGANALENEAKALIENGFDSGHTWRLQVGWRPFRKFGGYVDVGFSRISLSGTLDSSAVSLPGVNASVSYDVHSRIDSWFVELGYQGQIASRVVLAAGFGLMRATSSSTSAESTGGVVKAGQTYSDQATTTVDDAIEKYGIVPTLNLRLGFDVI